MSLVSLKRIRRPRLNSSSSISSELFESKNMKNFRTFRSCASLHTKLEVIRAIVLEGSPHSRSGTHLRALDHLRPLPGLLGRHSARVVGGGPDPLERLRRVPKLRAADLRRQRPSTYVTHSTALKK